MDELLKTVKRHGVDYESQVSVYLSVADALRGTGATPRDIHKAAVITWKRRHINRLRKAIGREV